jgi:hypothetical protein
VPGIDGLHLLLEGSFNRGNRVILPGMDVLHIYSRCRYWTDPDGAGSPGTGAEAQSTRRVLSKSGGNDFLSGMAHFVFVSARLRLE